MPTDTSFITNDYWNDIISANGVFLKKDLDIYNNIYRFGFLCPDTTMKDGREFLFFTKPDLHIMDGKSGKLNPELVDNPFFNELLTVYPNVITELQYSADPNNNPFSLMLTNNAISNLDMPSLIANEIDTAVNIFGTGYTYRGSSEASDDNYDFSMEFMDTNHIDQYMYFKAYEEYETLKKHGRVTPPDIQKYVVNKRLHDAIGIYKFMTGEDNETIYYYAYFCGVTWKSLPRDAFSNPVFDDGIKYTIDGKAPFIEDMNPLILRDFNHVGKNYRDNHTSQELSIYDFKYGQSNFQPAKAAYIKAEIDPVTQRPKYKLKWRV